MRAQHIAHARDGLSSLLTFFAFSSVAVAKETTKSGEKMGKLNQERSFTALRCGREKTGAEPRVIHSIKGHHMWADCEMVECATLSSASSSSLLWCGRIERCILFFFGNRWLLLAIWERLGVTLHWVNFLRRTQKTLTNAVRMMMMKEISQSSRMLSWAVVPSSWTRDDIVL